MYSHVFMLFMFSCMKNDLILHIFLTRSDLMSMTDFTPKLRVTDLRCIRNIIVESRTGEMSRQVMLIVFSND